MNRYLSLLPDTVMKNALGAMEIAGHSLDGLANSWGTPLYLFDAATIRNQAESLRTALRAYPGQSEITYAAKAYFSLGMARKLAALKLGVDVVSMGELVMARKAGFDPECVHLHGNNKSEEELTYALEWGVHSIVVDSLEELEFLEGLAARQGKTARIWLRVTPGVEIDIHPYVQTGSKASKFGLPVDDGQAAEAIRRAKRSQRLELTGLHIHLGSQIHQIEPFFTAITTLAALAEQEGFVPEELSPGGGWGVPYAPGDPDENVSRWIEAVTQSLQQEFGRRGWPLPRLVLEPGRWLVARAGVALYRVGVVKTAGDGSCLVAVDGGIADNPRPALYQSRYTALLPERPDAETTITASVVGKFCESGDELIERVELPEVHRGDLLMIPVAGAYQLSMSSNYNMASRPAVLWLEQGVVEALQKRERPEEKGWWVDK